ncbi:MAG: peptide deformylase [Actinomycetota bacterium]|nr:peptide deformylase [Actinomycetota bacterium]
MTILPIKTFGAPVLREPTRPVERFDDELARLSEDMLESMYDAPGVGLAATQVGMSLRFFVYDDGEHGAGALANMEIISAEDEQETDEGCLSVPGLWFPVRRAGRVRARGLDLHGEPVELEAEGLLARILQHETDHVDGMLYLDRLSEEHRRHAMQQLRDRELNGVEWRSSVP